MKETKLEKVVQYYISEEAYEIVGKSSKRINVRKSMFIDSLIKRFASVLTDDIESKIKIFNDESTGDI